MRFIIDGCSVRIDFCYGCCAGVRVFDRKGTLLGCYHKARIQIAHGWTYEVTRACPIAVPDQKERHYVTAPRITEARREAIKQILKLPPA
jgi:hypothetical protein